MKKATRIWPGCLALTLYVWVLAFSYYHSTACAGAAMEVSPEAAQWQSEPLHSGISHLNPGESQVQRAQRVRTISLKPLDNDFYSRSGPLFSLAIMRQIGYHVNSRFLFISLSPLDLIFPFHSFW